MSVYKRQGTTNLIIEFRKLGEHVRQSAGTSDWKLARQIEEDLRRKIIERRKLGVVHPISLAECLDDYLCVVLKPKSRPDVLKNYAYVLDGIAAELGPNTPISDITPARVQKWVDKMVKEGKAAATTRNYLAFLKATLAHAARKEQLVHDLKKRIKLGEANERERYLTENEERRLLDALEEPYKSIFTIYLDTGLRRSEALNLLWRDVFPTEIRVVRGKGRKSRTVPLSARAQKVFAELRQRCHNDFDENRPVWNIGTYELRDALIAACEKAGIEDFRTHDCRHTFASKILQRGGHLAELQKLLGHANIQQTMRYAHLASSQLQRAIALLN
jgi:integrase